MSDIRDEQKIPPLPPPSSPQLRLENDQTLPHNFSTAVLVSEGTSRDHQGEVSSSSQGNFRLGLEQELRTDECGNEGTMQTALDSSRQLLRLSSPMDAPLDTRAFVAPSDCSTPGPAPVTTEKADSSQENVKHEDDLRLPTLPPPQATPPTTAKVTTGSEKRPCVWNASTGDGMLGFASNSKARNAKRARILHDVVDAMGSDQDKNDLVSSSSLENLCQYAAHAEIADLIQSFVKRHPASPRTWLTTSSSSSSLPLHVACRQWQANLAVVETLVEAFPAALYCRDEDGYLPCTLAFLHGASLSTLYYLMRMTPPAMLDEIKTTKP